MSITAWGNSFSKLTHMRNAVAGAVLLAPILLMTACGGGSKINQTPVNVQITPGASTLVVGRTQAFAATVTSTSNRGVSWAVQEGAAGGSITAAGVYTAPMKAGVYHVVATSLADSTKAAAAAVTATAPAPAITSSAPTSANEGDVLTYALAATDPVNTAITFSLASGPEGAQMSGSTLTWTPTHAQSRTVNAFNVQAATSAGGTAEQKFTLTPLGTIRGMAIDTYVTEKGTVTSAEDLTTAYIGASVQSGNSWTTIQGIGNSDGTFQIPGVPAGKYWLAIASGGYWTSASDLDIGQDFLGRQDGVLPFKQTSLALNFLSLHAWDTEDSLDILNPNLSQDFDWSDNVNPGDTSVAALWPWTGPLSDASNDDSWYATQTLTKEVGSTAWRYVAKATPAMSITQTDGSTTDLSGTFGNAPQLTVHLKVMGSQFAALAPAVGLNAAVHSTTIGIYSQPFSADKGSIGDAEPLLQSEGQEPITTDVDFGDIAFGNPFPSEWTPFVGVNYELAVPFTASGATTKVDVPAEIHISSTQFPTIDKPLAPVITPVLNMKLNGSTFAQRLSIATLTPSLSWDPPATGIPTGYRVTIFQLSKTSATSMYQSLLDLFTKDDKIAIPDGVLLAGNEYFFAIRAYLVPNADFTTAPYHASFPWAHADMLTAVVSTNGGIQSARRPAGSAIGHIVRVAPDSTIPRAGDVKHQGIRIMKGGASSSLSR